MKKGCFPVFLLMAGMMMSCGKKEDIIVEEPKVYAIDSGEIREGENTADGAEIPIPEGGDMSGTSGTETGNGADEKAGNGNEASEENSVSGQSDENASDKKAGELSGYQAAYEALSIQCEQEDGTDLTYNLIDVDGGGVPELAAVRNGYYVSLYTWDAGNTYTLMDHWSYGAMGNAGYEYCPGKNSLRNYNTDYAGAILYTTYMKVGSQHTIDTVAEIVTYNFDDVNGNGKPDEEEESSMGFYSTSYINGAEATDEECAALNAGEYEFIQGVMSGEELRAKLKEIQ